MKKQLYIGLFIILYLIVAFSSFWHAIEFFSLTNYTWMAIILAFAFEIGQAAVLFAILTSNKERSKITPWILMTMLTLVQIIGNVFSSYKYIMSNNIANLKFFKEPIFIWTNLPDAEATVIITYISSAILPITALLLTSMIANYLEDNSKKSLHLEDNKKSKQETIEEPVEEVIKEVIEEPEENKIDKSELPENIDEPEEDIPEEDTEINDSHFINI